MIFPELNSYTRIMLKGITHPSCKQKINIQTKNSNYMLQNNNFYSLHHLGYKRYGFHKELLNLNLK